MALVLPYTKGLTASKWEGFVNNDNTTYLPPYSYLVVHPKWYFTSPAEVIWSPSATFSRNSLKIYCAGFLKTQWRALSLPLWAIPNTMSLTPIRAALSTSWPKAEVPELRPSPPYRLKLENLDPRKSTKAWSLANLLRVLICYSLVG